jgi:hypothetical protein
MKLTDGQTGYIMARRRALAQPPDRGRSPFVDRRRSLTLSKSTADGAAEKK